MDVPDATGRTGVSALDPSPLFLPSSPDLSPTISYIYIYIYTCTYTYVSCAWTRTGQGKVVKHGGDWHFPSYCWRRIRTCRVFSGQGMHLAARTTGLEGRACWIEYRELGKLGLSRNGRCSKLGFDREGIIGIWEWWKELTINLSSSLFI